MIYLMTVADDYLIRAGGVLDLDDNTAPGTGADERLPGVAGRALKLSAALQPVVGAVIRLGGTPAPGTDATDDASWSALVAMARRDALALSIEGDPVIAGLREDSLRLLARIDTLVGDRPGAEWEGLVHQRVQRLIDARLTGHRRGNEARQAGVGAELEIDDDEFVAYLARHPEDRWYRSALRVVTDTELVAVIGSIIDRLAPSYAELRDLDWSEAEAVAETVCEVVVLRLPEDSGGLAAAKVTASTKGALRLGDEVAVSTAVEGSFPFRVPSVALGEEERWLMCGRIGDEGALLVGDGTRRLAAPALRDVGSGTC